MLTARAPDDRGFGEGAGLSRGPPPEPVRVVAEHSVTLPESDATTGSPEARLDGDDAERLPVCSDGRTGRATHGHGEMAPSAGG
jgi:hypothetical protein